MKSTSEQNNAVKCHDINNDTVCLKTFDHFYFKTKMETRRTRTEVLVWNDTQATANQTTLTSCQRQGACRPNVTSLTVSKCTWPERELRSASSFHLLRWDGLKRHLLCVHGEQFPNWATPNNPNDCCLLRLVRNLMTVVHISSHSALLGGWDDCHHAFCLFIFHCLCIWPNLQLNHYVT